METSKNDKLIQKLRSTSPSVVYQTLVEIRTKDVNSASGVALLRKRGALKYFVKLLQKPYEKILDVTLSILGNCCLENETRLELWRLGAVGPIVRILEGVGKDSIQGRTCRILGNLAQLPEVAAVIYQEGAVPVMVGILGTTNENGNNSDLSSISETTKQMAVRALRVLAENPEYRMEIINQGGVRAVAELLSSTNEELQKAAMKALATLTHHCSEECASQVQGDGACFERLVSFVWDPNLTDESRNKPSSSLSQGALICLANLARVPEVRPKLGNAGAINAVVNQLRHASNLDLYEEWKLKDLVSTLCLFCRESVNRMKLRDYGGLSQLLIHLKDDKHGPVAAALCNFAYDELGFRQLVEYGLIQICVDRLRYVISAKLKENGRSHTFVPVKSEHLPKKISAHRSSVKFQKLSPGCTSVFQQVSVDDCSQNISPWNQEHRVDGYLEESNKKLLKSPMKTPTQKTFRVSSPSYQAVRHEQEGLMHCNLTCSSPPSAAILSSSVFGNSNFNGSNCGSDCSPVGSSSGGGFLWSGNSNSFPLSGFCQAQGPVFPMPVNFLNQQFQEGLLSPEALSCCSGSGGSSSSCTSGYASSPRSDLSDAPSPSSGYSTATTNDSGEVYSPVYDDGSDDSGEEDLETKDNEEKQNVRISCSKRMRKEDSFSCKDLNELKIKKKCPSLLEDNVQTSSCGSVFKETFLKVGIDDCKSDFEEKLLNEEVEGKMVKEDNGKEKKRCPDEGNEKGKNENSLVGYLLILLSYASQLDDPVEGLASHNTFSALLDYHIVNQDPAPRATRILTRIVRNEHYLIPLINQRFVIFVRSNLCLPLEHLEKHQCKTENERISSGKYTLSKWNQCSECIRLKTLGMSLLMDLATSAESGFGEGELAYGLLKGDDSIRMAIALSLPFIIRVKKLLRKLLLNCNGFVVLLDILRDHGNIKESSKSSVSHNEKDEEEKVLILNAAVDGLSHLADAVGISLTRKISKVSDDSIPYANKEEELLSDQKCLKSMHNGYLKNLSDKVIFSLDDGSFVNANREGLSSISPVFRAMLQGNFLESKEGNLIKLPGVSNFCLNYILHHLGECSDINCLKLNSDSEHSITTSSSTFGSCHWAKKPLEVYSALELVSISDRFLLPDAFRKKLANQVLDWYLCPESAAKIYMWCIGSEGINGSRAPEGLGLLEGTLKYILIGDMTLSERVTLIKSVFDVGLGEELLSDMNDIIRMFIES